ncbi:uncharacterized protein LOC135492073 [Lineus longissimus]|uniref:uncharacterized protein LOC135492073 n=1 Tax=Lineus longissimus TaxID=88925 RepID=UPI002B4EFEA8
MMASGSSSRDDFEAALEAISRFNQLNSEAARILGEQQTTTGGNRDVDVTAGEENREGGDLKLGVAGNASGVATSAEDVQRILGRKEGLQQNGHGETAVVSSAVANESDKELVGTHEIISVDGEGVAHVTKDRKEFERSELYDEEWFCVTDSESQASDIVKGIISKSVQDLVGGSKSPVAAENAPHLSSSPVNQEEKVVDEKKVVSYSKEKSDSGSDFPDSTDETSSFFSDTEYDSDAAIIDEKSHPDNENKDGRREENRSDTENKAVEFDENKLNSENQVDHIEEKTSNSEDHSGLLEGKNSESRSSPFQKNNSNTVSEGSPFEENKELTDNLKALRDQFTEASLSKAKQQVGDDHKPLYPDESSEASEEESGNETKFIQDGHEVDPLAFFDNKSSEPVGEAKDPEPKTVSPQPDIENAGESDTKGQGAVWKAPAPLLRTNTFTKDKDGEASLVSETDSQPDQVGESDPVSPDKPAAWKAPHSLISSPSHEAILKSESEAHEAVISEDSTAWTKSEKDGIWRAPVPIISPRTSMEEIDSTPPKRDSAKDESEPERRGLWKAPYPLVSRDSFPPISDKETAGEISVKFAVQKVESDMPLSEKDPDSSMATDENVPSLDELLARFQRLRSEDDLMPNIPPGEAAEGAAIKEVAAKDDLAPIKETDASSPKQPDEDLSSDSNAEPTEKSDIFSTPNTKFYRGYIDVAGSDQEGSFTSRSTYSVHTNEEEESEGKVGSIFEGNAEEVIGQSEDEEPADQTGQENPDVTEKVFGEAADFGGSHDSDWMSEEEDAGAELFDSDSESDVRHVEKETAEETELQDKESFQDEPAPPENVEEPKTNISSDFKSSVDTSVWSASDDEIPGYDGRDALTSDGGDKGAPKLSPAGLGTCPGEGAAVSESQSEDIVPSGSVGIEQFSGIASVTSMFDVPPPREPEPETQDLSDLDYKKDEEEDAKKDSADDTPDEKNIEDVPQTKDDVKSDEALLDSSKPDTKRPKSSKFKRKGSVGKSGKQVQDEERVGTPEVRPRRRSHHKRDKKEEITNVGVGEIALEGSEKTEEEVKSGKGLVHSEGAVSNEAESLEKVKKRSRRKGRKMSNAEVEKVENIPLEVEHSEPARDNRDAKLSAVDADSKQSKDAALRKPRRPSSGRPKREEARVKFDDQSNQDAESLNTDVSSERQSRGGHRKPRTPMISETLYHQQPFTNEDMLDEKYVELIQIMRNDGIQAGELVKEVGVVLARAGLSPRSPREVPKPAPHIEKAKPKKEEQDRFKPMPGVHVIPAVPLDSDKPAPVSKSLPAESHSSRKHYTASSLERLHAADSFERTQKQLYRKYNELNALLNRQLPDESTYLVQEQLEQTLALLQRHQKQGHFHSKPEGGERHTGSQGQRDRPKSAKSVSFREARPGSGRSSRSPRRSKHEKAIIDAARLVEQKDASDGSESESQSRSRSRSYSPTDCNLRNTKNPDVRSWLRGKNRRLRQQKRAERLKELEEKRIEEEKLKERDEKVKESTQHVQNWMKQKQKEARLLSKREEDVSHKIGQVAEKRGCDVVETTQLNKNAVQQEQFGQKMTPGKSTPKRPVSAPGVMPIVSRRKPLAATADNIVKSNKRGGSKTGRSVDSETRDSSVGASNAGIKPENIDTCNSTGAYSEQQKQRPKSLKRRKKKENKPVSEDEKANTDLVKKRLSYDQWLQEKRVRDNKQKKKEKKLREKQLRDSDHALDSLVPDLARRRIRFIESSKKRVDSGVHSIDDEANSYPRGAGNVDSNEVDFSLNAGAADAPTEEEERYQWRLEGEVSRPKSGKPSAPSRSTPGSARPSSSPVSKTRARARLTMPKSDSSPRSRVENISEKGQNPFKSPIPVVNASLKRSGDARNRYAKQTWTNFSDDVWKQVNEEEGVGPFQVVDDSAGGRNGADKEGQGAAGTVDASGASNGDATPEVPNGLPNKGTSAGVPNGEPVTQDDEPAPGSASGNVDSTSPEPAPSSSNVNFGGIFYTVDTEGVQHGIHEVPVYVKDKTNSGGDGLDNDEEVKDPDTTSRDGEPSNPCKKKVNFGGIVYEVDKKEESPASSSEIEEEMDMSDGVDDEAPDGFFITSIDNEA